MVQYWRILIRLIRVIRAVAVTVSDSSDMKQRLQRPYQEVWTHPALACPLNIYGTLLLVLRSFKASTQANDFLSLSSSFSWSCCRAISADLV